MVKAFLFDYDGVMTAGVKGNPPAALMAQNLGISVETAAEWLAAIGPAYGAGQISEDDVWKAIEEKYQKPIAAEQRDIWYVWEELTPLPEMVALVQQLRAAGYVVGLLSNIIPVTARLIRERGGYDGFDFVVLSCDVGASKPEKEIYQTALSHFEGIAPEEVMFLDDIEACAAGARALGIQAIHVTDHARAIAEVRSIAGTV